MTDLFDMIPTRHSFNDTHGPKPGEASWNGTARIHPEGTETGSNWLLRLQMLEKGLVIGTRVLVRGKVASSCPTVVRESEISIALMIF